MERKISVLLASDFPILRHSVADFLNQLPDIHVVGCADNEQETLQLAELLQPQIALLDLELDQQRLRELLCSLLSNRIRTVLLRDRTNQDEIVELLRWGAYGVVSRRIEPTLLHKSICAVASGEIWISRRLVAHLVEQMRENDSTSHNVIPLQDRLQLTPRELQIVRAIGDGLNNRDIALLLGISENTVKRHLTRVFDKVGVYSRLELAMFATHKGLVAGEDPEVA